MRNLLPELRLLGYGKNKTSGSIEASVLFVDISGFTAMTRKLMEQGKEGAEILSEMMNRLFSPLIDSVYNYGGFITNFAGDAFTAVFKGDDGFKACSSAAEIMEFFKLNPLFEYSTFSFKLSARSGISSGNLKWTSISSEKGEHFFFYGDVLDEAAKAEHCCKSNSVSVTEKVFKVLQKKVSFDLEKGKFFFHSFISKPETSPLTPRPDKDALKKFIPSNVFEQNISGEFREVVSVFISYDMPLKADEINTTLSFFASTIEKYGGYISGFDYGDKGSTVLGLFGAPVSYEDNLERALNCLIDLRKNSVVNFRSGVTEGTVYAGFTGSEKRAAYTALGDNVNLSARLMMTAPMGSDWILGKAAEKAGGDYELEETGKHRFKGIDESIDVFCIKKKLKKEGKVSFKTAMTGREKELKDAAAICNKTFSDSKLRIHTVFGEAGIGKSRLVFEVEKEIPSDFIIFNFSADTILRQSMNIFTSFFQKFFNQSDTHSEEENLMNFEKKWLSVSDSVLEDDKAGLDSSKPYIAALSGIIIKGSVYEIIDAKSKYENTLFAIRDFFGALSRTAPMLMIFDDMHAIDKDSLEAFKVLTKNLVNSRTVIFVLSRLNDDGSKPDFSFSIGEEHITSLLMDRLAERDVPLFIKNVLGSRSSDELSSFVFKRSGGNPFFMEQLLLYMNENSYILEGGEGSLKMSKSDVEIPGEVNSILVSRLDRLSSKLKDAVFRASVLGNDIDLNILKDITLADSFNDIIKEGVEELIWNYVSEVFCVFRHALLRDAAYFMQLKSRLREIHHNVACSIEKNYPGEERFYSSIAFHYDKAGVKNMTILYLEKAGDYARSQYHNSDAEHLYERLLSLLDEEKDIIETGHVLGNVYKVSGKWDKAEKLFRESLKISQKTKDRLLTAASMKELGSMLLEKGRYDEAEPLLEKSVVLYKGLNEVKGECDVEGYRGLIHYYKGELDDAVEHFSRRLELSQKIKDKTAIALSYRYLGGVAYYRSDYSTAHQYYLKQLEMSKETHNDLDIAVAESNLGLVYSHMNDLKNAAKYYQSALDAFKKIGVRQYICNTSNNLGELKFWLGEYDEARRLFENQLQIASELGIKRHISIAYNYIGNICRKQGHYQEALQYYNKAIAIGEELNVLTILCEYYYEKATLFYEMDRLEEALELVEKAVKMSIEVNRKDFEFRSELLKWRIISNNNSEKAVMELRKMMESCSKDEDVAELNYHLFFLTGEKEHADKAVTLFETLYSVAPKAEYREKFELLKSFPKGPR